jgi:hypothetical protein
MITLNANMLLCYVKHQTSAQTDHAIANCTNHNPSTRSKPTTTKNHTIWEAECGWDPILAKRGVKVKGGEGGEFAYREKMLSDRCRECAKLNGLVPRRCENSHTQRAIRFWGESCENLKKVAVAV